MIFKLEYIFLPLFFVSIVFLFFGNIQFATISFGIAVLLFAKKRHRQKRKSTHNKHTDTRSGEDYDIAQNNKKGDKNKKYKKTQNPNKKGNFKKNDNK